MGLLYAQIYAITARVFTEPMQLLRPHTVSKLPAKSSMSEQTKTVNLTVIYS